MNKIIILIIIIIASACKRSNSVNPDPIDNVPVNITINLNTPLYFHLQNINSHVFESGGVKGVVIVHAPDNKYYAFDRACSYQPSNSCSQIEVDSAFYQFRCGHTTTSGFQKCCDSRFTFEGSVVQGPAQYGLKQYYVSENNGILTIQN